MDDATSVVYDSDESGCSLKVEASIAAAEPDVKKNSIFFPYDSDDSPQERQYFMGFAARKLSELWSKLDNCTAELYDQLTDEVESVMEGLKKPKLLKHLTVASFLEITCMAEAEQFARDKQGVITAICKEMKHILLKHEISDQKKLLDLRARLIIHEKAANCNKEIQEQELMRIQEMEIDIRGKLHRCSPAYYAARRTRHVCGIQEAVHKGIAQAIRRKLDISCKNAVEPIQKAEALHSKAESEAVEAKKKTKAAIPKKVKTDVWNTYIGAEINKHRCLCCKKTLISNTDFDVGHVVSEAGGGTLEIGNLRPICSSCNHAMGTRNMVDFVKMFGYYIG